MLQLSLAPRVDAGIIMEQYCAGLNAYHVDGINGGLLRGFIDILCWFKTPRPTPVFSLCTLQLVVVVVDDDFIVAAPAPAPAAPAAFFPPDVFYTDAGSAGCASTSSPADAPPPSVAGEGPRHHS